MRNQHVALTLIFGVIIGVRALTAQPDGPAAVLLVNDEAKAFGKEAVAEVNAVVKKIKERHGKDLFIETVLQGPEMEKATEWARDRFTKRKVDGVYLVITRKPGYFRIVVSDNTFEKIFTQANVTELEKKLTAKVSADRRIVSAAAYVMETMSKSDPAKESKK